MISGIQEAGQSEAELHAIAESIDCGILLLNAAGRVRLVNARLAQIFSIDLRALSRLRDLGAVHAEIRAVLADPEVTLDRWSAQVAGAQQPFMEEVELIRPERRVVERVARPVLDGQRRAAGWLEMYRDVTGTRLIQSKLLQTEKLAAIGQLISGIAHELSNPLTSIQGYAQLMLSRKRERERLLDAELIHQEAERAAGIIRNLLLFVHETQTQHGPVDLNEILERTVALRGYELKLENIVLTCELAQPPPRTLGEANQLQQVLLNLIINAEHAMKTARGSGTLHLRTRRQGLLRAVVEVTDNGSGIPREIQARIFDPFFTTKPPGQGTGLGLSIAYGIIAQHGGEIQVDTRPGQGTTFSVVLPLLAESGAVVASAAEHSVECESTSNAQGRRVLIVEDEPTVAQLIADVLTEEGHAVDILLNGRDALTRLQESEYDLVICDLKMPHMGGRALHEELVRTQNPARNHFLLVTGDTLARRTTEFLAASGLPHLAKPFLVEDLKQLVQQVMDKPGSKRYAPDPSAQPSRNSVRLQS